MKTKNHSDGQLNLLDFKNPINTQKSIKSRYQYKHFPKEQFALDKQFYEFVNNQTNLSKLFKSIYEENK